MYEFLSIPVWPPKSTWYKINQIGDEIAKNYTSANTGEDKSDRAAFLTDKRYEENLPLDLQNVYSAD